MVFRQNFVRSIGLLAAAGLVAALALSGCFSFDPFAAARQTQPSANAAEPAPAPADQPQAQQQPGSSGAVMAYKYQFNSFYGAMWNFGWFGYRDVPDQSGSQPGAAAAQPTREQLASALVGTESVTVQGGTFSTQHYKYTDPKNGVSTVLGSF